MQAPRFTLAHQATTQQRVGRHATRHTHGARALLRSGAQRLLHQGRDDGLPIRCGDVGRARSTLGLAHVAQQIVEGCLDSREGEVGPVRLA